MQSYRYSLAFRAVVLCSCFVILLTGLSMRLIQVQHFQHDEVLRKLASTPLQQEVLPARRGDIMDRSKRILATVRPVCDLYVDKHRFPSQNVVKSIAQKQAGMSDDAFETFEQKEYDDLYCRLLAGKLARPLAETEQAVYALLSRDKKDYVLAKDLDAQSMRTLYTALEEEGYRGLRIDDRMERVYSCQDLAAHVLGYTYGTTVGAAGVELMANSLLSGTDGYRSFYRDGRVKDSEAPQHGDNVMLTIDATFQEMVEKVIDRHYRELPAAGISAIFALPRTGEIVALANRPGFLPADGGNADPESRKNIAVASAFEPGSTFKLITHGAALNEGIVTLDTVVSCHGGTYTEPKWDAPLVDAGHFCDYAPVRDVIAFSLNTGTFEVAQRMDPDVYDRYIHLIGFGTKTGIHLSGETGGSVLSLDRWKRNRFELSRLGMGYNVTASPLQSLNVMSVICNEGNLVRPRILKQVYDATTNEPKIEDVPEILANVFKPKTARLLRDVLVDTVAHGTAKNAQLEGYVIGGKTGTAVKHIQGVGYAKGRYVASFVGFAGSDEGPALIGIVVVDDPRNDTSRYGGAVAAPIFKEIVEYGMYHFGVRQRDVVVADSESTSY